MRIYFLIPLILFSLFLIWNIFCIIVFVHIFHRGTEKSLDEVDLTETHYKPYIPQLYSAMKEMKSLPFEQVSAVSFDGLNLMANYYDRGSSKTAVLVHGYRATPFNNFSVAGLMFLKHKFNVLLIYQRAHGISGGNYTTMGVREQKDLLTWLDWLKENKAPEETVIYGTSMGATAVAYASDKIKSPQVKAIILDCCFTSFYDSLKLNFKNKKLPFLTLRDWIAFYAKLILHIDIKACSTDNIARTKIPVLFIHGKNDKMAEVNFTLKNFQSCNAKKQLLLVDNAGHTASLLVGGSQIQEQVISFINNL